MSWFKENKFTAIFGGSTAVVAAALGWLTLGAKGDYEKALSSFESAKSTLESLQNNKPFPNDKNVAAYKAEVAKATTEINAFVKQIAAMEIAPEDIRPNVFQDNLKQAVDRIKIAAAKAKTKLPGDKEDKDDKATGVNTTFDLGFEYLEKLPQDEATSQLAAQLKVVEAVAANLIANRATAITGIKRELLTEEKAVVKKAEEPAKDAKGKPKKDEEAPKPYVKKTFTVDFEIDQPGFNKALNDLSAYKEQFLVVRRVNLKNSGNPKSLLKDNPDALPVEPAPAEPAPAAPAPAAPATPAAPAAAAPVEAAPAVAPVAPVAPAAVASKFNQILGNEMLEVSLEIEMIDFAELKPDTKAKSSK